MLAKKKTKGMPVQTRTISRMWGLVAILVLLGKLFPNRIRGAALAVSGTTNWAANFAVTVTFLPLLNAAGLAGAYGLYTVAAMLSLPFVWAAARQKVRHWRKCRKAAESAFDWFPYEE